MKVLRNDLPRFLQRINNIHNIIDKALDLIAEKGIDLLKAQNVGGNYQVDTIEKGSNIRKISISGKEVAFIEYGIGMEGKAEPYKGELPQSGVPKTGSWVYYYDSKYKYQSKITYELGWFHKGHFTIGFVGLMPVYNTAQELRKYIKYDLPKDLKKGEDNEKTN